MTTQSARSAGHSRYRAFISYSRNPDRWLAATIAQTLESLARPWYRPRAIRIFCDTKSFVPAGNLREKIYAKLRESEFLIVLASHGARNSFWVEQEVEYWLANGGTPEHMIIILTEGDYYSSVPTAAQHAHHEKPDYIDLRKQVLAGARQGDPQVLDEPVFQDKMRSLAARLHGYEDKDDFSGVAAERKRGVRRLIITVITILTVLVLGLGATSLVALQQYRQADQARTEATAALHAAVSRQLAARSIQVRATDPNLAKQLAVAAYRAEPTTEAEDALHASSTAPGSFAISRPSEGDVIRVRTRLLFSPTDDEVAVSGDLFGPYVRLWSMTEHRFTAMLPGASNILAYRPDGRILVGLSWNHGVHVWDVSDAHRPAQRGSVEGDSEATAWDIGGVLDNEGIPDDSFAAAAAFRSDGRVLATAAAGVLRLWAVTTRLDEIPLATLPLRDGVVSLAFSRTGDMLVGLTSGGTLLTVNVTDPGHPRKITEQHLDGALAGTIGGMLGPDGRLAAVPSRDGVRIWDTTEPERAVPAALVPGCDAGENASTVLTLDERVLGCVEGPSVRLWEITDPRHPIAGRALEGHRNQPDSLSFSPNGQLLAAGGGVVDLNGVSLREDHSFLAHGDGTPGSVMLWDVTEIRHPDARGVVPVVPDGALRSASVATGSTLAARAVGEQGTELWSMEDPDEPVLLTRVGGGRSVVATALSADGKLLVEAASDGSLCFWNTGDPVAPAPLSQVRVPGYAVRSLLLTPDARRLVVSGERDQRPSHQLWDVSDPTRAVPAANIPQEPTALSDGWRHQMLAYSAAGKIVQVLDIENSWEPGLVNVISPRNGEEITALAFSPNGRVIAVGFADGGVRMWEIGDRGSPSVVAEIAHTGTPVTALSFGVDGSTLAGGKADGSVTIWRQKDTATPYSSVTVVAADGTPTDLVFNRPLNTFVSIHQNGEIVAWDLDAEHLADRICRSIGEAVTDDEWHRLGVDQPPCRG